jgi:tetrahydromethanopterin S-methyltransferase subunit G
MKIIDFKTRKTLDNSSFEIVKKIFVESDDINSIVWKLERISPKIGFSQQLIFKRNNKDIFELIIYLKGLNEIETKNVLIFLKKRNN